MKRSTRLTRGKGFKRATKPMARKARLKARRVPRAFRQRRDPQYASWVRQQRCLLEDRQLANWQPGMGWVHACWGRVQVCHIRSRGAGGDDRGNVVPLCAGAHEEQHRIGRTSFERRWGLDLMAEAARLDAAYQREAGAP